MFRSIRATTEGTIRNLSRAPAFAAHSSPKRFAAVAAAWSQSGRAGGRRLKKAARADLAVCSTTRAPPAVTERTDHQATEISLRHRKAFATLRNELACNPLTQSPRSEAAQIDVEVRIGRLQSAASTPCDWMRSRNRVSARRPSASLSRAT